MEDDLSKRHGTTVKFVCSLNMDPLFLNHIEVLFCCLLSMTLFNLDISRGHATYIWDFKKFIC